MAVDETLDHAKRHAARGWRPFPVEYGGKRPAVGIKWGTATATNPPDKMLALWFGREPMNIGIAARGSGLVFLDDDTQTADGMEKLCEAYGQELPVTYRVRTSKGWHWYFQAPDVCEIHNAGQGSYLKDEFGFDVRGNAGGRQEAGGYVVAAGSVHESGFVYAAEDPDAAVATLPAWLLDLLVAQQEEGPPAQDGPERERPEGGSAPRYLTEDQAATWIQRFGIGPLRAATEGGRNNALNTAACVVGHFVPEFFAEDRAVARLRQLAREVGLDEQEIGPTIRSGLRTGMAQSYIRIEGDALDDAPGGPDPDAEFKRELERARLMRRVRDELAAENREPLQVLDIDEFLDSPMPEYLVPRMFYKDGLSVVFGPPGAAKSFLVLDIALCLASGKPWRGRSLGEPGRVHYVMAEGRSTNTLRTKAWLHYYEIEREVLKGRFKTIPVPIILTDAGIADYLKVVEADHPDMIVLDTKNLMFAGKESQGEDYGAMLRVLHGIRETAGGAAVIMIDHSGLTDDTRTRGSNAQKGGLETEVRVSDENGIRRVEITRDKSGSEGKKWAFKLVQVPEVPRPVDVEPPAVCIPVEEDEIRVMAPEFEHNDNWNDPAQVDLPDDIELFKGKGKDAIKPLARFMRFSARGSVGFSLAQARKAIFRIYKNEKGEARWSEDTFQRAWQSLIDLERLQPVKGAGKTGNHVWEDRSEDFENV